MREVVADKVVPIGIMPRNLLMKIFIHSTAVNASGCNLNHELACEKTTTNNRGNNGAATFPLAENTPAKRKVLPLRNF
jgi:hypothetical protein